MPRPKGSGRPSMGDRHFFGTRVPRQVADLVQETADKHGLSYSEYLAWIIANAHGFETPMPTGNGASPDQGRLPMASAS